MPRPFSFSTALVSIFLMAILSGCGQRGPLYMPEQGKAHASTPIRSIGPGATTIDPSATQPAAPTAAPASK